jgi:hypothetical protein
VAAVQARLTIRLAAYAFAAALTLLLLEIGLRLTFPDPSAGALSLSNDIYPRLYSAEEQNPKLSFQLARQGGECLTYRFDRLYWNPWWGFSAKLLDLECGKALFASHAIRVVLMGGSAMANAEAPNHLTHIDYLAFKDDDRIASINLAESGARLSNMLARFMHEVIELKPNVAVFLDGFNEFNSVRYGGKAGDDFYWTAGVQKRIENPFSVVVDKLVEKSSVARLALLQTGLVHSARVSHLTAPPSPEADVQIYLRDRDQLRALCRHYGIQCIFILQPLAFVVDPKNKNAAKVVSLHAKYFPYDADLFRNGYGLLQKQQCDTCLDASKLFDDTEDAYFDVVHFTKEGGKKLGDLIHAAVVAAYAKSVAGAGPE